MSAANVAGIAGVAVVFATPRRLPKPHRLLGRVVVLDIAFVSEGGGQRFERVTQRFIEGLGDRLLAWVDHHGSGHHERYREDPRFVLATKAQHRACPEMITPELVARFGTPDTVVGHVDFDGVASVAKWILGGREPYPGCDDDARAIDTCLGEPGPIGARIERALRARPRDERLRLEAVRLLATGAADCGPWSEIDRAGAEYAALEQQARRLAGGYRAIGEGIVIVDVPGGVAPYDKTALLLFGQELALTSVVVDGDTATFAAPFDSGIDFVARLGLSGGMPTRVSIRRGALAPALTALGVDPEMARRF